MGAWGPGIFDNDVAMDVKLLFEEQLQHGLTTTEATQAILYDPPWGLDDEEDEASTYLALASLQLEHGTLDAEIRDKALAIIESGVPMWGWENTDANRQSKRKFVIDSLINRIQA